MGLLTAQRTLLARWPVMQLYVRCALVAHDPSHIQRYVACGHKLAALGAMSEAQAQQRMLRTRLLTALDEGLPAFWRSACLECTRALGVSTQLRHP